MGSCISNSQTSLYYHNYTDVQLNINSQLTVDFASSSANAVRGKNTLKLSEAFSVYAPGEKLW